MAKAKAARKKRDETKQQIITSTYQMLTKEGLEKFTLQELISRLNIGVGTFYYYFESKDDLLYNTFLYGDQLFVERFEKKYGKVSSHADKLLLFLHEQALSTHNMTAEYMENYRHVIRYRMMAYYFDTRHSPKYRLLYEIIEGGQASGEFIPTYSARDLAEYFWTLMAGAADFARLSQGYDILEHIERLSMIGVKLLLAPQTKK